jgi:YgiT-type zinc finger domain-containing protein
MIYNNRHIAALESAMSQPMSVDLEQNQAEKNTTGFWDGETCEYCGGPIVEKHVTLYRKFKGQYMVFEHVPAGVCKECGTRYYAAKCTQTRGRSRPRSPKSRT